VTSRSSICRRRLFAVNQPRLALRLAVKLARARRQCACGIRNRLWSSRGPRVHIGRSPAEYRDELVLHDPLYVEGTNPESIHMLHRDRAGFAPSARPTASWPTMRASMLRLRTGLDGGHLSALRITGQDCASRPRAKAPVELYPMGYYPR
jgi:hypothetical protein